MGTIEKNTFPPSSSPLQLSSIEHKLDHHFRDSDYFLHQKSSPSLTGYSRQFGSLEQEIQHYLEPGPLGNKVEKDNRTDY
jgi:hypothetical protein